MALSASSMWITYAAVITVQFSFAFQPNNIASVHGLVLKTPKLATSDKYLFIDKSEPKNVHWTVSTLCDSDLDVSFVQIRHYRSFVLWTSKYKI